MSNKYLELATSKDTSRYNLTAPYRTIDKIVATDGHRMHWINGQEPIEKGFYIDGQDHGEFPDISHVMPKNEPTSKASLRLDKHDIAKLKALAKLAKLFDSSEVSCKIIAKKFSVEFEVNYSTFNAKLVLTGLETDNEFTVNLNLNYFLDAVELPSKEFKFSPIEIEYHSRINPIVIKTKLGNALIMPLREPRK